MMMKREKYQKTTDKAWNKLYDRLDRDGLLAESRRKPHTARIVMWSVAAAVLLALLIPWFVPKHEVNTDNLISQRNDDLGTTLVKTLEDNSIVYITGNSILGCPSHFSGTERQVNLDGEALFDVTHQQRRPFVIHTKGMVVQVLGTCFNIKSGSKGAFELAVFRGCVKVTDQKSGDMKVIHAGEMVRQENNLLNRYKLTDDRDLRKYNSNIRFKDEKLGNIVKAINTINAGKEIKVSDAVRNRRLTVAFANDSPQTMSLLLSEALHLQCIDEGNVITIK
jgi:ferric-dicitrate binding protein FerR (iron transport regulator)